MGQGSTAAGASRPGLPFIIGASAVGTLIEWYDFYIYGVLAVFFSQHFFPPGNEAMALLASLGIFWPGFIVRPLGSVIFDPIREEVYRDLGMRTINPTKIEAQLLRESIERRNGDEG